MILQGGLDILKLIFEKLQEMICLVQIWSEFEAQMLKIYIIHRKSRIKQTPVCFANISATKAQIFMWWSITILCA